MLVSPLTDYFTKESKFMTPDKAQLFAVGIIKRGGEDIPLEWIGKVIYYHTAMGSEINIKGVGSYELIASHSKLLVRLDQDEDNY